MNRLFIATRGVSSWRERLANPDRQWKRACSALETAVSWESASSSPAGVPEAIVESFRGSIYADPVLVLAIAEHKVPLAGKGGDSQCDVWALLHSNSGGISLSVEGKAKEGFGAGNESLAEWLANDKEAVQSNRRLRWEGIQKHLPPSGENAYSQVAYQLLHRCAAAVIEARRLRLPNAAFVVQAFESPSESFTEFARLCRALGVKAEHGRIQMIAVGDVRLGIGWADCPLATDSQMAALV